MAVANSNNESNVIAVQDATHASVGLTATNALKTADCCVKRLSSLLHTRHKMCDPFKHSRVASPLIMAGGDCSPSRFTIRPEARPNCCLACNRYAALPRLKLRAQPRSKMRTVFPFWVNSLATVAPPGPDPTTMTSAESFILRNIRYFLNKHLKRFWQIPIIHTFRLRS